MALLTTILNLSLVILGFGFIIFIHELGHFLAARWAGIRVLAFAVGFGPPVATYRKGIGLRRQSTEAQYLAAVDRARETGSPVHVSPTEYRLNALPFGGYVKMLGQEDINPNATSDAPDSYQRCVPWKKLVVISAGVIMNMILAGVLFVIVFMVGREVNPPIVGRVEHGRPASVAIAPAAPMAQGLLPGDVIERVNDATPDTIDDVMMTAAMASPDATLLLQVRRQGVAGPLVFEVRPQENIMTGLRDLGFLPARSAVVAADWRDLRAGMVLTHVAGKPARSVHDLDLAVAQGDGQPLTATFRSPVDNATIERTIRPRPQLQVGLVGTKDRLAVVQHLLGLTGVMTVGASESPEVQNVLDATGLRAGDIVARLGELEYPSLIEGRDFIRKNGGRSIPITVLRAATDPAAALPANAGDAPVPPLIEVQLPDVPIRRNGRIGINISDTTDTLPLLARPLRDVADASGVPARTTTGLLGITPGSVVTHANGTPVATLRDVQRVLRAAVPHRAFSPSAPEHASGAAHASPGDETITVTLTIQRATGGVPAIVATGGEPAASQTISWTLSPADVSALRALSWESDVPTELFDSATTTLKASGPLEALAMGAAETKRVMLLTYLTFVRLVQGTVKIEHLKGPVGIAHLGTLIADRGLIWLLFFLALISVNLAVINFLPMPIVDGGQFLFILYEWIRGRPVPVQVQNVVTIAGLVMIGTLFLLVTYHDIRNLIGI